MSKKIKAKCSACKGTGIYVGFAEPEGYGVECNKCNGYGYFTAEEFTKIGRRRGVKRVLVDGGLWFTRGSDEDCLEKNSISYEQWIKLC